MMIYPALWRMVGLSYLLLLCGLARGATPEQDAATAARQLASSSAAPPPTPAPGTLGCTVTVDPTIVPPPAGKCASIVPCLAAMPASCATKTLHLAAGRYRGAANTRIDLGGADFVVIVGPVAPAPLRVGPGGAAEVDDAATAPPAAVVATIDGEDAAWLFAVGGSAILSLVHVVLARGLGGKFDRGDGAPVFGGGALRMVDSGVANVTRVLFDSNEASNPASSLVTLTEGGAVFSSSDGAMAMDGCTFRNNTASGIGRSFGGAVMLRGARAAATTSAALVFEQCLFEGNSCVEEGGGDGGGVYVQDMVPRFIGCTWHDNKATGSSGLGGGGVTVKSRLSSATSVAPVFDRCFFVCNSAGYGGGTAVLDAAPIFSNCIWRGNKAKSGNSRGGGVAVHSSFAVSAMSVAPTFEQCLFESNTAVEYGGGTCVRDAAPRFSNCTWRRNTASSGEGGGVYSYSISTAPIAIAFDHCVFIGNIAAGQGGGGALATSTITEDVPTNLAFEAGKCSNYSCVQPDSIATPPPAMTNTFRQWKPRLQLFFDGATIFDGNAATVASGGAISAGRGGSVVIRGGASFCNNRAGLFGGAAYLKAGSASLMLLGSSTWANNSAGSARGDHLYSESSGAIALGSAALLLDGEPNRVREGVVAVQAGNVSWGRNSSAECEPGYTLSASTSITTSTFRNWVLEGSSNGTAGFRNGSNCPDYYVNCAGGLSKSTDPSWARDGYHDPKATPVFPPMRVTRVSVGCAACGATEWSDAEGPLPGVTISAATTSLPLNRTCDICSGRMSSGISCEAGKLIQRSGWWRPDTPTVSFGTELFQCYTDTCVGSANSTAGLPSYGAQCKTGYGGPVCALCIDGYTMQAGQCRTCPRLDAQNITVVSLLVLAVLAFGILAFLNREQAHDKARSAILKITLGFFQLVSVMERSFAVQWPPTYRKALFGIKLSLSSVIDLPSAACAFTVNWYGRLLSWTFGMLGAALVLWAIGRHVEATRAGQMKWFFYLAFFCYPLATPVIVSIFDCRTVAGTLYLDADYTLTCEGGTYALAATWAALWTMCFVLGFPAAVALALWRRDQQTYAYAVKFLSDDFKDGALQRMWEVVDLVRKMLLSSAVLFVPAVSIERISLALLISTIFQVLQAYHQPYQKPYKNRMAEAANAALSLTYFIALLVKASPLVHDQEALGVLLIMLLILVALAGFVSFVAVVAMERQAFDVAPAVGRALNKAICKPILARLLCVCIADRSVTRSHRLSGEKEGSGPPVGNSSIDHGSNPVIQELGTSSPTDRAHRVAAPTNEIEMGEVLLKIGKPNGEEDGQSVMELKAELAKVKREHEAERERSTMLMAELAQLKKNE